MKTPNGDECSQLCDKGTENSFTIDGNVAPWQTLTSNPENWKEASPIYFLNKNTAPFMIYTGSKTYESIKVSNKRFLKELHKYQPNVTPIVLNKKHIPMVLQYIFPWNNRYDEIINFMNENKM